MSEKLDSTMAAAKPLLIGLVIGVFGLWATLAWGFGWMSHGAAHKLADHQTRTALVAAITPECMARFERQVDLPKAWQALNSASNNFTQTSFMKKGGWVIAKEQKIPSADFDAIANSCADKLLAMKQLGKPKLASKGTVPPKAAS